MSSFADVLRRLPEFSGAERKQLQLRLDLLDKDAQLATNARTASENDWLLFGISTELHRRGLWPGSGVIPRSMLPPGYAVKAREAREYLLKGVGRKLRSNEQIALGALAGASIVERFNRVGVPVSPRAVLNSLNQLGPALEEAFPGYWSSAALGVCLKLV